MSFESEITLITVDDPFHGGRGRQRCRRPLGFLRYSCGRARPYGLSSAFCDGRSVARDELLPHWWKPMGVFLRFNLSGDGTDYSALHSQVVHLSE